MLQNQTPKHNRLVHYRRRMRFTPRQIARLIGHKDSTAVCQFESGARLPSLINAFRLGIILRVPVEFLFPALYDELRERIRVAEEAPVQGVLF